MSETAEDRVFRALADPTRRTLLDKLYRQDGLTLVALCDGLDMTRQAVSQHMSQLVAADLVTVLKGGRERLHFLNPGPIQEVSADWLAKYHGRSTRVLTTIKARLEGQFDD